jgi:hypothetical protein
MSLLKDISRLYFGTLYVQLIRMSGRKALTGPEDYKSWDKLVQHCNEIEGLTDLEKEKAKRAFLYLKQEFGEQFLEQVFVDPHPFGFNIINTAPWTRKWITWFAEAMKSLRDSDGFGSLLKRLKDKDRYVEAESVLEVAYKLSRAGLRVAFDPQAPENRKIPDLRINNEEKSEELFVEISIQRESMARTKSMTTMNAITRPLWSSFPFLNYCGIIHKTLSEKHLADVSREVEKAVERVKAQDAFQELVIEGTLELGLSPNKDRDVLEKWASSRGIKTGELIGPGIDENELHRIKMKIQKEQNQLPRSGPNILVINDTNLFFGLRDARTVIGELEECIYEFPHLLFAIVTGSSLGGPESMTLMKDQHVFVKKTRYDAVVEQSMIFLNRYCSFNISPATISKVYLAFGE